MTKERSLFVCQNCGHQSPRWMGRCPECGTWNSLVEEKREAERERPGRSRGRTNASEKPVPIDRITRDGEDRLLCGIGELDRVLGGGIVKGSLVLIGGDPGVGKSTLLLQMSHRLAAAGKRVLYVSGEESSVQTRMRAERVGALNSNLLVAAETSVESIEEAVSDEEPALVVVDSIQTVHLSDLESAPGSVAQVRESAARFLTLAKGRGVAVFLVGHMTKSGAIAGPRVLEHIVDTVLYFEGERTVNHRILRAVKNRFGSTNEIGVFEMAEQGLAEVKNPSEIFLAGRPEGVPGSAVAVCSEGTRPLLVEVQALVTPSTLGMPRRMAQGIDHNRLALLLAVLEKRAGLHLGMQDVYFKVAGGLRIEEPGLDVPAGIAIASAHMDKAVDPSTAFLGEIGLGGEIRAISRVEERLVEAFRMGFTKCYVPRANTRRLDKEAGGIEVIGVASVDEAIRRAIG